MFYPRSFDCTTEGNELKDFEEEFKATKAVSVLKIYVREMRASYEMWKRENGRNSFPPPFELTSPTVEEDVLSIA